MAINCAGVCLATRTMRGLAPRACKPGNWLSSKHIPPRSPCWPRNRGLSRGAECLASWRTQPWQHFTHAL